MRTFLPWLCLALAVFAVAAMPWRRPDPHHKFILDLLATLERGGTEAQEVHGIEHRTSAGSPHDTSSTHI